MQRAGSYSFYCWFVLVWLLNPGFGTPESSIVGSDLARAAICLSVVSKALAID